MDDATRALELQSAFRFSRQFAGCLLASRKLGSALRGAGLPE
jgi:hypothetical protein